MRYSELCSATDYDSAGRISRRYTVQGYNDYIYEDGTDWLLRETWHAITSTNVFDLVRYWYTNGRPSRVELANVSGDLQSVSSYSVSYIQYNWHGDAVTFVALDGSGAGTAMIRYDPWGNAQVAQTLNYYNWNGGWGYLLFGYLGESYDPVRQGLYYVHGRWYSPDTGMFLSPDEKGEYLYGSGNNPINEMWRQFLGGAFYQAARNNADTLALALFLAPPSRKAYEEIGQSIESSMPDTVPFRVGRVFGSTITIWQGISEINLSPTIAGGGTLLTCLTTGAETLGGGCIAGAGVSVVASGAVLVHGLSVTGVSLGNGYQNVMTLMSGTGASLKFPASELPTSGVRRYVPPKQKGNPAVVKNPQGPGYVDTDGNIWVWAKDQHRGVHWDVQHPDGSHTVVSPQGQVLTRDLFPNAPR